MKINYTDGLSRSEIFYLYLCKIFFREDYLEFKEDVDRGMYPKWAYVRNIKDEEEEDE